MQNANTKTLSPSATAAFCSQLAMLLDGGVSVHESLLILHESTQDETEVRLFRDLATQVDRGEALNQAMQQSGRFSHYTTDMVRIGEHAGRLTSVLHALHDYFLRQVHLRQTIRAAITHPLTMLCLLFALVTVLIVRVLPVFQQVYNQLGADMSPFSTRLLAFGQWLADGSLYIGIITALLALLLYLAWRGESGRARRTRFLYRLPLTKPLMQQIASSRFSFVMSLMLKSGLPFDQAAAMAANLFGSVTKRRIQTLRSLLDGGTPLSEAITSSGLFTAMDARLLQIGARVGALDDAMEDLAKRSQSKSDALFERIIGLIEPTLVALMALVAGMVLLSVMLPLLGIMAAV